MVGGTQVLSPPEAIGQLALPPQDPKPPYLTSSQSELFSAWSVCHLSSRPQHLSPGFQDLSPLWHPSIRPSLLHSQAESSTAFVQNLPGFHFSVDPQVLLYLAPACLHRPAAPHSSPPIQPRTKLTHSPISTWCAATSEPCQRRSLSLQNPFPA